MRVIDILKEELIAPELRSNTKTDVLREIASHLGSHYPGVNVEQLVTVLLDRERLGTTAIGEGIAIPTGNYPASKALWRCLLGACTALIAIRLMGRRQNSFFCLFLLRMQREFISKPWRVCRVS